MIEKTNFWISVAKKDIEKGEIENAAKALNHAIQNMQDCDLCHDSFAISSIKMQESGQLLCAKCAGTFYHE